MATRTNEKTLIGRRFNRLVVLDFIRNKGERLKLLCVCDCGKKKTILHASLNSGRTQSCGCLKMERIMRSVVKHGRFLNRAKRTREYDTWVGMRNRCRNNNEISYKNYGGRGISVCERWDSFENFLSDMGISPSREHSIERIDNNGNYEPSNCKWATRKEQRRNNRQLLIIERDGVRKCLKDWCEELGVSYWNAHKRIKRGWPIDMVLSKETFSGKNKNRRLLNG